MFKNLMIYRFPLPFNITREELNDKLGCCVFHPCGSQEPSSAGWVAPRPDSALVHSVGGQWLLSLMVQKRLLPGAVISEEVATRAKKIAAEQGYQVGRKSLVEIREQVVQEFLPRALLQSRTIQVWIDPVNGWMGVDTSSIKQADIVIEVLKESIPLPSFIKTQRSPTSVMTDWLRGDDTPTIFSIDGDCELRSIGEDKSIVKYTNLNLVSEREEIRGHLWERRMPTRLALTWDDAISFVLTDRFEVKRLQFGSALWVDFDEGQSKEEFLDAQFFMMTALFQRFIPAMIQVLGGEEEC